MSTVQQMLEDGPGAADASYCGAVHIHTDCSDGGVSVEHTIDAAQAAGLDFILITDHNTIAAREYEGYHGELLVAVDVEISPSIWHSHSIAIGLREYPDLHRISAPREILAEVERAGGRNWIPHPLGFCNPFLAIWNARWKHWVESVGAIELSTFLVRWVEGLRPWNFVRFLRRPLHVRLPEVRKSLALWDRLNASRSGSLIHGFVGIDAHYRQLLGGRVRSPDYATLFQTHNLQVWTQPRTGDAAGDLAALRGALTAGNFSNILASWLGRERIRFERHGNDGIQLAIDGASEPCTIKILADGISIFEGEGSEWSRQGLEPEAVHRAEIWRGGELWALTNPIRCARSAQFDASRILPSDPVTAKFRGFVRTARIREPRRCPSTKPCA